jgi:drug/metabolite transporter (DMT)-like permease
MAVLALGVLCTGIAYVVYFRMIERAGPTRALSVTFGIPVFALLYGAVVLNEVITGWMLLCGVIIVMGISLSTGLVQAWWKRRSP